MLYPIELRLQLEHVNKSPFARSVKPDFCERKRFRCVVLDMKPMKPDSLLPFAIAAILGFLVLGLNGGDGRGSSTARGTGPSVENDPAYKVKAPKNMPDLRVRLEGPRVPYQR